jgi:hypothetical protein
MNLFRSAFVLLLLSTDSSSDPASQAEAVKAAEAYLSALTGTGDRARG